MNKLTLLSAVPLLIMACTADNRQVSGITPTQELDITSRSGSFVGGKVNKFVSEYNNIRSAANRNAQKLAEVSQSIDEADAEYRNIISSLESKLNEGTTPSNPDMVASLNKAQQNLQTLEDGSDSLTEISAAVAAEQEKLSALETTVNATYAIPGAYDIDHSQLNELSLAVAQQKNANADIMAAVKSKIAEQQNKSEIFRSQITRLNVDVAAGHANILAMPAGAPEMEVKTIQPDTVQKSLAREKAVRSDKKRIKLAKKVGIIETVKPAAKKSAAKPAVKKQTAKPAVKKVTTKPAVKKSVTKKTAESAQKPVTLQENIKKNAETTKSTQEKVTTEKNTAATAPEKLPEGTIFFVEFPDNKVEYYDKLSQTVSEAMNKDPGVIFEVEALMPMNTQEQERIQNITAQIFGELLSMQVPPENLRVVSKSEIDRKVPAVRIVKK